ncbi:MAG TPA: integrase, partial [Legionella sp.]|nr:integrase [Legionella sp.]
AQRQWLDKVALFVSPGESLIPRDRSYKQHLSHYQAQAKLMGVCKLHGLRHAYAQRRYMELTRLDDPNGQGFICPIDGGKRFRAMTDEEKMIDRRARLSISQELGHSRINIVKIYIG